MIKKDKIGHFKKFLLFNLAVIPALLWLGETLTMSGVVSFALSILIGVIWELYAHEFRRFISGKQVKKSPFDIWDIVANQFGWLAALILVFLGQTFLF